MGEEVFPRHCCNRRLVDNGELVPFFQHSTFLLFALSKRPGQQPKVAGLYLEQGCLSVVTTKEKLHTKQYSFYANSNINQNNYDKYSKIMTPFFSSTNIMYLQTVVWGESMSHGTHKTDGSYSVYHPTTTVTDNQG